jgi:hypothetical protein
MHLVLARPVDPAAVCRFVDEYARREAGRYIACAIIYRRPRSRSNAQFYQFVWIPHPDPSLGARGKSKSAVSRRPEELREFGSYTMELGRLSFKAGALQMLTLQTFPLDGLHQVSTKEGWIES